MNAGYHVRYKTGETEIEVQSPDKDYLGRMLDKLLAMAVPHGDLPPNEGESETHGGKHKVKMVKKNAIPAPDSAVDAVVVANKVNEAENHAQIDQNILNKSSRFAKVLLAFHFAHECGFDQLTSGDVERITDQLGIKVSYSNASHCISDKRECFSAGAARRPGAKVPCKLNRRGEQAYKRALETGKV